MLRRDGLDSGCDIASQAACSSTACESSSTVTRLRKMEIRQVKSVDNTSLTAAENDPDTIELKRRKVEDCHAV
ncbi:hypothetical protein SAY87_016673 [Trapa incisa]|uniref:Uncharacterized protein n=1 Tax=Trapa incisa TaxID=236973 RepID=A0AAN7L6E4_9MYRT|nr:hypothetical protein SAY87_016673 [Trapa incisa]